MARQKQRESAALGTLYPAGPALFVLFVSGVVRATSKRKLPAWAGPPHVAMHWLGLALIASGLPAVVKCR